MQNHKVFAIIGCLMVLTATITEYKIGKLPVPIARRLPVESFPLRIGPWVAGPRLAVDDSVQEKLSTATILEHVYTNKQQAVDCMLVTASTSDHLHDPTMCFPAQGWKLGNFRSAQINGQAVNEMDAALDQNSETVMYWLSGYQPPPIPQAPLERKLSNLRMRFMGNRGGMSLFVRLMAPNTPQGQQTLQLFAKQIMPHIQALIAAPNDWNNKTQETLSESDQKSPHV